MPEQTNLEKIHPKFANEHQCFACGGYFLDENKDAVQCKRCIRNGRKSPVENAKDILHKDVNVTELSKKVAELEATIERLAEDKIGDILYKDRPSISKLPSGIELSASPTNPVVEQTDQKPKVYKDKKCSKCDKDFTPGAAAQKICHDCRSALIS